MLDADSRSGVSREAAQSENKHKWKKEREGRRQKPKAISKGLSLHPCPPPHLLGTP